MAIIRTEVKDYGGVEVWDDRDPTYPIYFAKGKYDAKAIDAVIALRQEAAKVALVDSYWQKIQVEASEQIEQIRLAKQDELADDYAKMTEREVKGSVNVTVTTTEVTP